MAGQWSKLRTYVAECTQLLYQTYFQPYTLRQKLRNIHPDLDITTNPFGLKAEFADNPALERYAQQSWWLIALTPIAAVLIFAPFYSLWATEPFDLGRSGLFLLGWWAGLWLARGDSGVWSDRFTKLIYLVSGLIILLSVGSSLAPDLMATILKPLAPVITSLPSIRFLIPVAYGVALGVVSGVAFGVAFGVVSGVAFGVANGVVLGVALGVVSGVAFGVAFGVALGVALGVVSGVASGVAFGVASGVVLGVASGVAWILGALRVYFWLPELLWLILLNFVVDKRHIARCLRWLPPYFDQLIYLPLPFMSEMIVEAYQQNPSAARDTIEYFTNSTNQQPVAARAMLGIAVDTLDRCRTAGDIAASGSLLNWIPLEDAAVGSVFPEMIAISQSVNAAYQGTTPYRRLELLQKPLDDLQKLKNSLSFAEKAKFASVFGSIINHWEDTLKNSQITLRETAQNSLEIPNRYLFGNALDPETSEGRFKGRQDIFQAIESISLSTNPPVWLLYGQRRTGKTSALKYLPQRVGGDLIPLMIDCQGISTSQKLSNLAQSIANGIIETARKSRNLKLAPIDPALVEDDPFFALGNWMRAIESKYPQKRFLLCLDEFERLEEVITATNSFIPLNFLRNLMQHHPQWILLFCGSHKLSELQPYWSDYLIGTRTLPLTYLQEPEARELILHPVSDFPEIYDPKAVDAIVHFTHCQPFFVQLVCYALVEHLNSQERRRVTVADVESIHTLAIERADGYFNEFWGNNTLSEDQRLLLIRLVQSTDLTEIDRPILAQLQKKSILEKISENNYKFQIPLVKKFVESKAIS